jgi:hypothetical protein
MSKCNYYVSYENYANYAKTCEIMRELCGNYAEIMLKLC